MIVIIDNYDSFTYNLYHYLCEIYHKDVKVIRNDKITVKSLKSLKPEAVIISPGPSYPKNAGISLEIIKEMGENTPILGVCLGHQTIGEYFGAEIIKADKPMHGKISTIENNGKGIFQNLPSSFDVTRYHSLIISGLTEELEITAWHKDIIMGIQHKKYPIYGVQFHPESIASEYGKEILANFINII